MRLTKPSDVEWFTELLEHEVVRRGMDGLEVPEGMDLMDILLLNAEKLDVHAWLRWLTNVRGLLRVHKLEANPDWIAHLPVSAVQRKSFAQERVLPLFESGGSWICASLRGDGALRAHWEEVLGKKLVLMAPTPVELRAALKQYR